LSPESVLPGTSPTPPVQTHIDGIACAVESVGSTLGIGSVTANDQGPRPHPRGWPKPRPCALLGFAALLLWSMSCATETIGLTADADRLDIATQGSSEPSPPNEPLIPAEPDDSSATPRCNKIDLLYVVDNSQSMREEQDNLIRSFPAFIDVVQGVLGNSDYQIMVVDTDAAGLPSFNSLADLLEGRATCDPAPSCCGDVCVLASIPYVEAFVSSCNGTLCADLPLFDPGADPCEGVLGAGRRLRVTGEPCGIGDDRRYMRADQPDLSGAFSCAAQVGTAGNGNEQPMGALLAALSAYHNDVGGCNSGFLREDALLVVTFITDEEDVASPGDPDQWRQAVLDAKGGDEASVVILGLVGDENLAGASCASADGSPRLQEFVQSFRFGSLGSVCSEDYTPFFEAAVTGIETSCREFGSSAR
jgi:hypothetical protein